MRPRLLPQTDIVRLDDDRVCLRNAHRVVRLADAPLFGLVTKLAPRLTGEHTLEEITAGLDPRRGALVADLVRRLCASGLVRDLAGTAPAGGGPVGYVDTYAEDAESRFERFRALRTLVIGSGPVLDSCLRSARTAGLENLSVIDPDRTGPRGHGSRTSCPEPDWGAAVEGHDAVLHLADGSSTVRAERVDTACAARGVLLLTAVVRADEAWIGPVVPPGGDGSWRAAWQGLRLAPEGPAAPEQGVRVGWHPHHEAAGVHLLHPFFAHATGSSGRDWTRSLTRLDLRTGETSFHPVRPRPVPRPSAGPGADAEVLRRVAELRRSPRQSDEEFSAAAARVVDRWTGPIVEVGEEGAVQFPLSVSKAVAAPAGAGPDLVAHGAAPDLLTARLRAVRRAAERRALSAAGTPDSPADEWILGVDLETGAAVRVTVEEVLGGDAREGSVPAGLASAATWSQALVGALLSWSEELAGRESGEEVPLRPVPRELFGHDPEIGHLYALLDLAGLDVVGLDGSGRLGVPTCTIRCDGVPVARACGLTAEDAMRSGLERALLWWQSRASGQPAYAPAPVSGPSPRSRPGAPVDGLPPSIAGRDAERLLIRRLARAGHRFTAVPLDHDPALRALVPHAVRLVASRA